MTENYYRTGNYKIDHTTFGGELTLFDFEGHYTLAEMAEKISKDLSFDKKCCRNIKIRNFKNKRAHKNVKN